jgi:hypothetical protein
MEITMSRASVCTSTNIDIDEDAVILVKQRRSADILELTEVQHVKSVRYCYWSMADQKFEALLPVGLG